MAKIIETLEVLNERGFHARPAALFAQTSGNFQSEILVKNLETGNDADGKSVMSLLMLAAPQGTKLEITVNGEDAETAMTEIKGLFARGFDEE